MPATAIARVNRRVHREYCPERSYSVVGYVAADKAVLLEVGVADAGNQAVMLRSADNGRTWEPAGRWEEQDEPLEDNVAIRCSPPGAVFVDAQTGGAFRISLERAVPIEHDGQFRVLPQWRWGRSRISYSFDQGVSWSDPKPMVQKGASFDTEHPFEGVWWGKNACYFASPHIIQLSNGEILLMMMRVRLLPSGDVYNSVGITQWDALPLLGRWNSAGTELEWEAGQVVPTDYNWTMNGMCENAVAQLPDGRVVMVSRSQWPGNESRPSVKLFSVSDDQGRTWSRVEPLRYEDGQLVSSPASMPGLFYSAKTDRLYFIGNILPLELYHKKRYTDEEAKLLDLAENPPPALSGPRNVLQIAEMDTETLRVKRDTVTVIDKRARGEPPSMELSNFSSYEDRETGNIVLYIRRTPGGETGSGNGISNDVYRYDIELLA